MIVSLEVCPLPSATDQLEASDLLAKVMSSEVPAFVIETACRSSSEAVSEYTDTFNQHGLYIIEKGSLFEHRTPTRLRQRMPRFIREVFDFDIKNPRIRYTDCTPLHVDFCPIPEVEIENLVFHFTEEGQVEARFYEPTEDAVAKHIAMSNLKKYLDPVSNLTSPN